METRMQPSPAQTKAWKVKVMARQKARERHPFLVSEQNRHSFQAVPAKFLLNLLFFPKRKEWLPHRCPLS